MSPAACGVDVLGGDGFSAGVEGVAVLENASVDKSMVADGVADPVGKGFDWAVEGTRALLVDALALDFVSMIEYLNCSLRSCEEGG